MLKVLHKRLVQLDRKASAHPYYAELICDDVTELPSPGHYGDWIIDMGSVAHVINTGDTYMLNSDGNWILQKKTESEGLPLTTITEILDRLTALENIPNAEDRSF